MEAVRKIIDHSSGSLTIEVPKEYDNKKLEVIVIPLEEPVEVSQKKYDFSDLVGKLKWEGNALDEQRKLRNEWD